jgi:hypothetical protein
MEAAHFSRMLVLNNSQKCFGNFSYLQFLLEFKTDFIRHRASLVLLLINAKQTLSFPQFSRLEFNVEIQPLKTSRVDSRGFSVPENSVAAIFRAKVSVKVRELLQKSVRGICVGDVIHFKDCNGKVSRNFYESSLIDAG